MLTINNASSSDRVRIALFVRLPLAESGNLRLSTRTSLALRSCRFPSTNQCPLNTLALSRTTGSVTLTLGMAKPTAPLVAMMQPHEPLEGVRYIASSWKGP